MFRVVEAYQQVLYAQRAVEVAQHEQETAAALLTSVDDHVKAGLAVESDRMSAQVNVAARKQELIAAQGDLELAWAALREAMGSTGAAREPSSSQSSRIPSRKSALEDEIGTAAKTRPDLMALGQAQSAQASALSAAKSSFGPRVSAYGNWEEDRTSFAGSGGNNWVAGVQISVDILPFGKRAQLARETRSEAEGRRADGSYAAACCACR